VRRASIILVAALAIPLGGCILAGKPKATPPAPAPVKPAAPAPAPEPLSTPQTDVHLPPFQQVDPDALVPAPAAAPPPPEPTKPPAPLRQRQATTAPAKPVEPPATPPPEPAPRAPIQEILPADVLKQFQASAKNHRSETGKLLAQAHRRGLNPNEERVETDINQYLKQSQQAEDNKDMRAADEFAEKAYILAKELQGGK
jgi:hypothetical protein